MWAFISLPSVKPRVYKDATATGGRTPTCGSGEGNPVGVPKHIRSTEKLSCKGAEATSFSSWFSQKEGAGSAGFLSKREFSSLCPRLLIKNFCQTFFERFFSTIFFPRPSSHAFRNLRMVLFKIIRSTILKILHASNDPNKHHSKRARMC
jgi:hypothetical protein